jgi:hypothetical protein
MINRILILLALLLGLLPAQAQFQSVTTTANGTLHSPTTFWAQNSLAIASALAENPSVPVVRRLTESSTFAAPGVWLYAGNATLTLETDGIYTATIINAGPGTVNLSNDLTPVDTIRPGETVAFSALDEEPAYTVLSRFTPAPLPTTNGLLARTGDGTTAARTITAGDSNIIWTNGNGISGNPTSSLNGTLTGNFTFNGTISAPVAMASRRIIKVSKGDSATDTRTGLAAYDTFRPFSTLQAAYAASASGDTIILEPGEYAIGNLSLTKSDIAIIGYGQKTTTLNGTIAVASTATKNTLRGFRLYNSNDSTTNTFFVNAAASDVMDFEMRDILIECTVDGDHVLEVSGENVFLENVHTKATNAAHGHLFVLKGYKNASVVNCSSNGNGSRANLFLKSDSAVKGNAEGIFITGFIGTGASNGLYVETVTGSTHTNVVIKDSVFRDSVTHGIRVGDASGTATGNLLTEADIDVVIHGAGNGVLIADCAISDSRISIAGTTSGNPLTTTFIDPALRVQLGMDVFSSTYGLFRGNFELTANNAVEWQLQTAPSRSLSNGVLSGNVRAIATDSTDLYIVIKTGYEWQTSLLTAGDPVWVVSGTGAGMYRYLEHGTVGTGDVPITGALVGDFWVKCEIGALATSTALDASDVFPGLVLYQIKKTTSANLSWNVELTTKASNSIAGQSFESTYYFASGRLADGGNTAPYASASGNNLTTIFPATSALLPFEGSVYLCVFGKSNNTAGHNPATLQSIRVDAKFSLSTVNCGLMPASTLP